MLTNDPFCDEMTRLGRNLVCCVKGLQLQLYTSNSLVDQVLCNVPGGPSMHFAVRAVPHKRKHLKQGCLAHTGLSFDHNGNLASSSFLDIHHLNKQQKKAFRLHTWQFKTGPSLVCILVQIQEEQRQFPRFARRLHQVGKRDICIKHQPGHLHFSLAIDHIDRTEI